MSILLFVPTPLIRLYHSRQALQGSADKQTRILTFTLTKCVFIVGAMLVVNAMDGGCTSYYTYNRRFNHIGGTRLLRLPTKILNAFQYFGLYKLASRMGTDLAITALSLHRCGKVDWSKTAMKDWFVSYDLPTVEFYGVSEMCCKQVSV